MKTKTTVLIFLLITLGLAGFFFYSKYFIRKSEHSYTRSKVINTFTGDDVQQENVKLPSASENEKYETFVPLLPGETLIGALTVDINNDGYDDELIVVRKTSSPYLWIVPGVYNASTHEYDRYDEIKTMFTRTRTFSYSAMDIIGDHKNSIIYQGVDDSGNYVMQIYNLKVSPMGTPSIVNIGDFSSDGTVFIQQTERSENYELGIARGESFSVWVYKSEQPDATPSVNDGKKPAHSQPNQIQQEYKWNPYTQHYELAQQIKVNASRIMAKELSKIQDGTVESFAAFLNGLWYKTSNDDGNIRYLYFNYNNREIIHLFHDTQEVYQWDDSKLRHNGIYLTTVNSDIMTLHRRFDISLLNTDEIRVTIRDDINLLIKESTTWDGNYKKLSIQNSFEDAKAAVYMDTFYSELKKSDEWKSADGQFVLTFKDSAFEIKNGQTAESGVYSILQAGNDIVLQLLPDNPLSVMNEFYTISFGTKIVTETVKKKEVEKSLPDYDKIILIPVKMTPTDCFPLEGRSFQLSRGN
ncbi:pallilysin-related adhesin [Treponema sp. C6A8]|uniref:pallilysin-related adhesin n=1 Tax=Treponema sp. C6A8 TaxID=1410609 RepID=UPI0004835053|nr:pallilysin-related adhesin [Treponema sp. C6A8]